MAKGTKTKRAGLLNLRTTETGRFGHYTAHLLDPAPSNRVYCGLQSTSAAVGLVPISVEMTFPGSATGKNPIAALTCRGTVASSVEGLSLVPLLSRIPDERPSHKESCSTKPPTYGCLQRAPLAGGT